MFCYLVKFDLDLPKAELTNLVFVWLVLIEPLDCATDQCDWLIELSNNKLLDNKLSDNKLSDNKLSDNKLSDNKLSDNNLASELVENRINKFD